MPAAATVDFAAAVLDFAQNLALLAVVVALYNLATRHLRSLPAWAQNAMLGAACGIGAVVAMLAPVRIAPGVFVDLRSVILGLAGLFGGPLAAAMGTLIACGYRLLLGGAGMYAGVTIVAVAAVLGTGLHYLVRRHGRRPDREDLLILGGLLAAALVVVFGLWVDWQLMHRLLSTAIIPYLVVTPIATLLLGWLLRDESLRRETALALGESERRFAAFATNVPVIIVEWRMTRDDVISYPYFNKRVLDFFGVDPAAAVAHPHLIFDAVHGEDRSGVLAALRQSRDELTVFAQDFRIFGRDGKIKWLHAHGTPRRLPDGAAIWDGTITDNTERKLAEQALGEREIELQRYVGEVEFARDRLEEHGAQLAGLADDLAIAKARAESASTAKSQFLANMSHELRTPLNAVIGFSDLIRSEALGPIGNERYIEYAGAIRDSGEHLLNLINDILDLSKIEAGKLTLVEEVVEVGALVDSCVQMLMPRAAHGNVAVTASCTSSTLCLRGDGRRLRQIVLNLLTNAIKYTPPGGSVIVASGLDREIGFELIVRDTGIGIAEADRERVMQAFVQAEGAHNHKNEGTGLGLPLTSRLVELHGGTLTLDSVLGAGTTVTVRLPRERVMRVTDPRAAIGGQRSA